MPEFPDRRSAEPAGGTPDPGAGPWIAGVVPVEVLLARSEVAAVVVGPIRARPGGFVMSMTAYRRGMPQTSGAWTGAAEGSSPARDQGGQSPFPDGWSVDGLDHEGRLHPRFLRFGLLFADGGSVQNVDYNAWRQAGPLQRPAYGMTGLGGHGQGRAGVSFHEARYAVWPLPAPPALQIVCEWPAFGIPQTTVDLDTTAIHDAAARAYQAWET